MMVCQKPGCQKAWEQAGETPEAQKCKQLLIATV